MVILNLNLNNHFGKVKLYCGKYINIHKYFANDIGHFNKYNGKILK